MVSEKKVVANKIAIYSRKSKFTGKGESIKNQIELCVGFISIKEQFDTSSPMGRAMMYIASVFSQLERETIAERIRDNMQELAKTGGWLGGTTPTSYQSEAIQKITVDEKIRKALKLTIIPDEANW